MPHKRQFTASIPLPTPPPPPLNPPKNTISTATLSSTGSIPTSTANNTNIKKARAGGPEDSNPEEPEDFPNWQYPVAMDKEFSTFINHGCELDRQGYPLYPNGSTTFVLSPGADVKNFGNVGYTKTSSNGANSNDWKVVRVYCKGVLVCDCEGCDYTGPPPTGKGKIDELLSTNPTCKGLAGRCLGKIYQQKCLNTQCRFDFHQKTGWGLMRHRGVHAHPWPSSKKADPLAKKDLTKAVLKNPKASALQLKIGKTRGPAQAIDNVVNIHESLGNSDRLRHLCRQILQQMDLGSDGGDKFMHALFQWQLNGMEVISIACKPGHEHITLQTNWMSQRLLDCGEDGHNLYSGGLILDVTYRFFAWIRGLSESYYTVHFTVLFCQFPIPSLLQHKRENMARSIVDFSKAQQRGFVAAYMEVFGESNPDEALRKLKGCREHFRQSITQVKQNRAALFESKCLALLQPCNKDGPTHDEKIDEMRRRFPKTKAWLDWWTMADVESILFPSHRKMLEDSPNGDDGLPSSTNAQESMHRLYYMFSAGKKTIIAGFSELYAFVKALEKDHLLVMRGIPIRYGIKAKGQQDITQSIRWIKPTKQQRAALNDGQPPDTTQALLNHPNKRAKSGRLPNSQNINQAVHTTFVSYAAEKEDHLKNQCWLAAALESLYAVYSPLWLQTPRGKKTDIFHTLVLHFTSRTTNKLIKNKNLKSCLTRRAHKLFEEARKLHPHSFIPGEYASCDFFMEILLDPKSNSSKILQSLFSVQESCEFLCPQKLHNKKVTHPRGERRLVALKLTTSMFAANGISSTDAESLITQWTTSGLAGASGLQCKSCNNSRTKKTRQSQTTNHKDLPQPSSLLDEVSLILFPDSQAPPHLYFHINISSIRNEDEQQDFMGKMIWPFKLTVSGEVYTLISRGYWGADHYWGKVLRNIRGVTGVWLHNDRINAGFTQLVDPLPGSISGAHPHTSWLIYLQGWTNNEAAFVEQSVERIRRNNPKITSVILFSHMKNLLNISYNGDVTVDHFNPPTTFESRPQKKHIYHGNIGDNISDPSCSGTSSKAATEDSDSSKAATEDSDNGDGELEPESGSDASEYEAPGCPPSPPNHSEPIKIRLRMLWSFFTRHCKNAPDRREMYFYNLSFTMCPPL
ncbi:hypothetical protein PTTG_25170 [Puccinia triticina 1-1 BBBD Race 1]|uniref:GCM domain-containing protein n=1 Tax=Puccinia triticina (isolate 1-1 / race 1 (BBBD)) TaxID=630390 RepID=A0A180H557_PUCT1|nr:hypothetical protein PTTG_25170 [Puccinia triticina 1-1 BBBD Race 1]